MAGKVAVVFNEEDIVQIEMIVRDRDQEAALELVREIKKRIDAMQRSLCGQGVMGGTQPAKH